MTEHAMEYPTDEYPTGDERTTLLMFLEFYRAVLARKAEGLTEDEVRTAACPPSDLTLLGLVRHMAEVEQGWFQRGVQGLDRPRIFSGPAHPDGDDDGDWHPPAGDTMDEAFDAYWTAIAEANRIIAAEPSLDVIERRAARPPVPQYNLRWILVHMIEEYARHCGHADLLRQAIDGATGD